MSTRLRVAPKRILVTGGAGYLGSVVVDQLLDRGWNVRVLDSLLFGEEPLGGLRLRANCSFIRGDVRDIESVVRAMTGCDAAIHLAGIVGDQACEANRQLAAEVNGAATRMLADVAPRCGIRRLLFASSCSVYGTNRNTVSETSRLRPLSLYAQTKVDSEKILLEARTRNLAPTVLRLGTLFGLSARMRFDLVVNLLVARAMSTGQITIKNGWQWRPFVHVRDAARAFVACLERPVDSVSGEIFNVGSPFLNAQIKQLGEIVARVLPGTIITEVHDRLDRRTYRASFDKIARQIGFTCEETLEAGVCEISAAVAARGFSSISLDRAGKQMSAGAFAHAMPIKLPLPRPVALRTKLRPKTGPAVPIRVAASRSAVGD